MYARSVQILSAAFLALGLTILVSTFAHGGGPLSLGVLLGVAFLAVGVARLWLAGAFRGWRGGGGPHGGGRGSVRTHGEPRRDRTRGRGHP